MGQRFTTVGIPVVRLGQTPIMDPAGINVRVLDDSGQIVPAAVVKAANEEQFIPGMQQAVLMLSIRDANWGDNQEALLFSLLTSALLAPVLKAIDEEKDSMRRSQLRWAEVAPFDDGHIHMDLTDIATWNGPAELPDDIQTFDPIHAGFSGLAPTQPLPAVAKDCILLGTMTSEQATLVMMHLGARHRTTTYACDVDLPPLRDQNTPISLDWPGHSMDDINFAVHRAALFNRASVISAIAAYVSLNRLGGALSRAFLHLATIVARPIPVCAESFGWIGVKPIVQLAPLMLSRGRIRAVVAGEACVPSNGSVMNISELERGILCIQPLSGLLNYFVHYGYWRLRRQRIVEPNTFLSVAGISAIGDYSSEMIALIAFGFGRSIPKITFGDTGTRWEWDDVQHRVMTSWPVTTSKPGQPWPGGYPWYHGTHEMSNLMDTRPYSWLPSGGFCPMYDGQLAKLFEATVTLRGVRSSRSRVRLIAENELDAWRAATAMRLGGWDSIWGETDQPSYGFWAPNEDSITVPRLLHPGDETVSHHLYVERLTERPIFSRAQFITAVSEGRTTTIHYEITPQNFYWSLDGDWRHMDALSMVAFSAPEAGVAAVAIRMPRFHVMTQNIGHVDVEHLAARAMNDYPFILEVGSAGPHLPGGAPSATISAIIQGAQ